MDTSTGYVKSEELVELQNKIKQLAQKLDETYKFVYQSVKMVKETWKDRQLEEFESNFRSRQEKIKEISDNYMKFASEYLPQRIEDARNSEGVVQNI